MPGNYRQRIRRTIEELAENPHSAKAKTLRERPTRYRIALDEWRIIYDLDDDNGLVLILRIRIKQGPQTYEGLD